MAEIPDDDHLCDRCRLRPTWQWVASDNPENRSRNFQCDPCRKLHAMDTTIARIDGTMRVFRDTGKGG